PMPVHAGESDVEQSDVGLHFTHKFDACWTIPSRFDRVAPLLENNGESFADVFVIFDEGDAKSARVLDRSERAGPPGGGDAPIRQGLLTRQRELHEELAALVDSVALHRDLSAMQLDNLSDERKS